jgi:hypothetical protein
MDGTAHSVDLLSVIVKNPEGFVSFQIPIDHVLVTLLKDMERHQHVRQQNHAQGKDRDFKNPFFNVRVSTRLLGELLRWTEHSLSIHLKCIAV